MPAVLKTRRFGYDGRGQVAIDNPAAADAAWEAFAGRPLLLERLVEFSRELSIIGVRGHDGEIGFYPLVENEHRGGILYRTHAPAPVSTALQAQAEEYLRALLEKTVYVGVLAWSYFKAGTSC